MAKLRLKGTDDIIATTVANEEIVPLAPAEWTFGFEFKELSFINKTACHIVLNGEERIFLDVEQGIEISERHEPIRSLVIEEISTQYQYIGSY